MSLGPGNGKRQRIITAFLLEKPMRVVSNPEDIGRCGCGRRDYCDGSHRLTDEEWQAVVVRESGAEAVKQSAHTEDKPS